MLSLSTGPVRPVWCPTVCRRSDTLLMQFAPASLSVRRPVPTCLVPDRWWRGPITSVEVATPCEHDEMISGKGLSKPNPFIARPICRIFLKGKVRVASCIVFSVYLRFSFRLPPDSGKMSNCLCGLRPKKILPFNPDILWLRF